MPEPVFAAKANCLLDAGNVDTSALSGGLRSSVDGSVARFGNWVGGTVVCWDDRLAFLMNEMNKAFQHDTGNITLHYADIQGIRIGSMMRLLKTVDIATGLGLLRFRCWGRTNDQLYAVIREQLSEF